MTTSVTRSFFTTHHQTRKTKTMNKTTACKTKTDFFFVWDRSCPKTDGDRPHHRPAQRSWWGQPGGRSLQRRWWGSDGGHRSPSAPWRWTSHRWTDARRPRAAVGCEGAGVSSGRRPPSGKSLIALATPKSTSSPQSARPSSADLCTTPFLEFPSAYWHGWVAERASGL